MRIHRCLFCGGDASEPNHRARCDGRQGAFEFEPYTQVRTTDPDTSHAAAWSLQDLTEVQRRVYEIHLAHPEGLTDEQLLRLYERQYVTAESSPRKRRCDLTRHHVIEDSGQRRVLVSGRLGIVWVVVPREEQSNDADSSRADTVAATDRAAAGG